MLLTADLILNFEPWGSWINNRESFIKNLLQLSYSHISKRPAIPTLSLNNKKINQCSLSILLTSEDEIQKINSNFRKIDKSTNVISFPSKEVTNEKNQQSSDDIINHIYLGDIAVSYQNVLKESLNQKKPFLWHFYHLLIHSFLHLCGYEHSTNKKAEIMESLEIHILSLIGINNPYLINY